MKCKIDNPLLKRFRSLRPPPQARKYWSVDLGLGFIINGRFSWHLDALMEKSDAELKKLIKRLEKYESARKGKQVVPRNKG